MKKILFSYFIPTILILPLTMISCSSINNNKEVKKIKAKISEIIKLKPLPTLNTPLTDNIELFEYRFPESYINPQSPETGFTITVDSIELPVLDIKNLKIWLKVGFDNPNIYDQPEISELYFVEFTEIKSVGGKPISPIPKKKLQDYFENIIEPKKNNFEELISDAFYGRGYFDKQTAINPGQENEKFKERLTSANINKLIFNNLQNNIGLEYMNYKKNTFTFKIFLGKIEDGIWQEIKLRGE